MGFSGLYSEGPTYEEVHGDKWAARIRAQHEQLGAKCPCGNGKDEDNDQQEPGMGVRAGS